MGERQHGDRVGPADAKECSLNDIGGRLPLLCPVVGNVEVPGVLLSQPAMVRPVPGIETD